MGYISMRRYVTVYCAYYALSLSVAAGKKHRESHCIDPSLPVCANYCWSNSRASGPDLVLICTYILNGATLDDTGDGTQGALFRTKDVRSDEAWSDPLIFYPNKIDPDIFFEDGKFWVAQQGIIVQELDLETGG